MPLPPLDSPKSPLPQIRGWLVGIPAVIVLSVTVIIYNLSQIVSLVVAPFSRRGHRRFMAMGAVAWWRLFLFLSRLCHGVRVEFSGDPVRPGENALIIANHQQMTDITFLTFVAERGERLGDLKWFVKDEVKYVPGIGWGMLLLDNLFVKRDWMKDKERIEGTFRRLREGGMPFWVVLFAEGTRLTAKKLERSSRIRARQGKRELRHLLTPHTRGFAATVEGLGERLDAVYDLTFGYKVGVPSLWQYILGYGRRAWIHVRRHDAAALPQEREELSQWMEDRFAEKDELLERFYTDGGFEAEPSPGPG